MRRFKALGLVLMAVLVVGAVAVAAASATMVLPEFKNAEGFTGTSGAGVLEVAGQPEVKCTSDTSNGGPESGTSKKLGTFQVRFLGCTTFSGLVPCNGLGNAAKEISTSGSYHLVLNSRGTHRWFILFLPAHQHLECSTTLILVLGTLLGQITPTSTSTKRFTLGVTVKTKKQEFTEYENEGETIVSATLKGVVNETGSEKEATELSENNVIEFVNANEITN